MSKLQPYVYQVLVRKLQGLVDDAFARCIHGPLPTHTPYSTPYSTPYTLLPHCMDTAEAVVAANPNPNLLLTLTLTPTPTRMRSPGEHAGPHPLARILEYLDELHRRGCFGGDNQRGTVAAALPLPALLEQVARLRPGEAGAGRSVTERAFAVLTERWVATALIDAARLDAATARIAAADGAGRDDAVLRELVSLAAPLQYDEKDQRLKDRAGEAS